MKPVEQYKTLLLRSPWDDRNLRRYEYISAEGVAVEHAQPLDFLQGVPGLRRVFVWCFDGDPDVSPVFDCPDLEDLTLLATAPTPLRADRLPRLRLLKTDWRPGLESLRDHPALTTLVVYGLREPDLSWLGAPPHLERLHIQGTKQAFDLGGLEALAATLTHLSLSDLRVPRGSALPPLPRLVESQLQVRGLQQA